MLASLNPSDGSGEASSATPVSARRRFSVVTAEDADGGLRLSLAGAVDASCIELRETVIAALRAEPPRVEVDLAAIDEVDDVAAGFLLACGRLARQLGVEYRLTRAGLGVQAVLDLALRAGRPPGGWPETAT